MRRQTQFICYLIPAEPSGQQFYDSHLRIRYFAVKLGVADYILKLALSAQWAGNMLKMEASARVYVIDVSINNTEVTFA